MSRLFTGVGKRRGGRIHKSPFAGAAGQKYYSNFTQKVETLLRISPDPKWFPRSSPPAPSAASSRSCGWPLKPGRLPGAEGAAGRAEAGVVAVAAAPGGDKNERICCYVKLNSTSKPEARL